ncbi:hypothetical protein EV368DRAFT_81276 [Lentinula lateritia]|nr:hypothetical protein EV368DRAFT_81276 [Lentinula lateritia]
MSTFHQLMTFDQSSTNFTQPPIPTAGPATEPDGPRSFAFVPTLGILVPHPPPPVIQVQRQDTLGQDPANAIVDGSGSLVGNFNTGAGANHYPSSAGVPRLPPILQVEKQQVTTSATQLAIRSDGGAECRAKHTMKAASADHSGPSQLPPAILHIPLQTAQSPPQVPPKLQVPP